MRLLLVGAGALGGEFAALLPSLGVEMDEVLVVDDDRVEESNLPRESVLQPGDVGRPKAEVVRDWLCARGTRAAGRVARVERLPHSELQRFDAVACAADTVRTRRYVNHVAATLCRADGRPRVLLEGGTEGCVGHARLVAFPAGRGACVECTRGLYAPGAGAPVCGVAGVPRTPAHVLAWARAQHDAEGAGVRALALAHAARHGVPADAVEALLDAPAPYIPAVMTTTRAVAGLLAHALAVYASGGLRDGAYWQVHLGALHVRPVELSRDESCAVCGV